MVLDWLLKKIVMKGVEIPRQEPSRKPDPESLKVLMKVEEELSKVIVPGYDVDLISSRVVTRLRLLNGGKKLVVFVDFTGSDPSCYFCKFLNWRVWSRILKDARERLQPLGFEEIEFRDSATLAVVDF